MRIAASLVLFLSIGCGGDGAAVDAGIGSGDAGVAIDAGPRVDAGPTLDAGNCQPPDMLFVLDRTMSMHRRPDGTVPPDTAAGHMESKWYLAIASIEAVTASLDQTIRFGLELFPIDRDGGVCVTLSQRISGTTATNVQCEGGEVPVSPGIESSTAIAAAIDPETTRLCRSTPIGGGLGTAMSHLSGITDPIRDQFAVLLTDGQDTCDEALSLSNAQGLAAAGINLYVIGFDGSGSGVDNAHLNDLACAGKTAPGFPAPCTDDGSGNFTATSPDGAPLYFLAESASQLQLQLEQVAGEVCCDCIK